MKFYEIDSALRELYENAINDDGELSPELEWQIEKLEMERDRKIEGCGIVYKEMLAEAKALGEEVKALAERKKVAENKAERLKYFLSGQMRDGEKIKTERIAISWRKSERVEIDPLQADRLPLEYQRVKTEPDKTALKDALKAGKQIEGVLLVTSQNLQIK